MTNIILQIISLVLCLVGVFQVIVVPKNWNTNYKNNLRFLAILFFYSASVLTSLMLSGKEDDAVHIVLSISVFLEFLFAYTMTAHIISWLLAPDTKIKFVTGYSDFALRAFEVHANGYLMKPVLPAQITAELEHLGFAPTFDPGMLHIQCFGNFEVFWEDKPLTFKRRRTKELFAYLIDRNGASCSAEEVIAVLWEDEGNLMNAKHNLRNLVTDLRTVLGEIGQQDILIRGSGTMAVDRARVDCDYFHMLDVDISALNSFRGEYMKQYGWAQITEAKLYFENK